MEKGNGGDGGIFSEKERASYKMDGELKTDARGPACLGSNGKERDV